MPQTYTLAMAHPQATIETVGGKAALARLSEAGLPVPMVLHYYECVPQFVTINKLQEQILAMVSGVKPEQPATLEEASSHIRNLFMQNISLKHRV